jgi:hypothetical protein
MAGGGVNYERKTERQFVCKRCGGVDHMVRTCTLPPVEGGRPNLEVIEGRLVRGEMRSIAADKVLDIIAYVRTIEAHRRVLIRAEQERLTESLSTRLARAAQ